MTATFHPLIQAWFSKKFGQPTPAQVAAWPAIARGEDVLITAPTGSGKTLAAFLSALDRLVTSPRAGTRVVYVSPLKALSNDVQRNLSAPIAEIRALALELGLEEPDLRASVRTGDTPAHERQREAKNPPHVLVTTPESLYILLTSASGRRSLEAVETIILDEIHAIAGDKRGAHLALSVERLEDLVVRAGNARPQRVGLSATVKPIETAARLLVGSYAKLPTIVDVGQRRDIDLAIEVPRDELGAVCTNEQWEELYDRLEVLAREHTSTLVFVNTRKLVERVTHHLGLRLGEEVVAAHHGSLSRQRRHDAEQRLKAGSLRLVVATASLELGIDVGAIDLTCIVGSPRSIGTALQRIGRSGHFVGMTPKGRFFPLTRDQLVECGAIVRAARRGVLDAVTLRDAPRDVLAQQLVASVASEERSLDDLFTLVRGAAPYASLERARFDEIVDMVSEGIASRRGRIGALAHKDAVNGTLKGRRGARIAALTSGGAIPDNASYDVLQLPEGLRVGSLDEDFAIESMAGDIFLLGNTSWRIKRVAMGKVWVEDAKGAPPSIPFWLGEAPARTRELSTEVSALRVAIATALDEGRDPVPELRETCAMDEAGATLARDYVAAGIAALGAVPTEDTIVLERFFDESGGMQLVVHAPFGGRVNRALGMALRKRFCRSFDFELQAAATDDGVLLSLGAQHSFPLESLLEMLRPESIVDCLQQAALQAPMFGTRFRWNATRSLSLLRMSGGKRVPPPLLRMRSDDLLASVFPAQVGCQDNHGGGPIEVPDHPLVDETMRDCLCEAMDAAGLIELLEKLRDGRVRVLCRDNPEPSVLSHELLNANPYAFLDDAPLEERRTRAVNIRRGLPASIVERVGGLDADVIAQVLAESRPAPRDADELHDLLLDAIGWREDNALSVASARTDLALAFERLVRDRRAARLVDSAGNALWVDAERRAQGASIWPERRFVPELVGVGRGAGPADRDEAIVAAVRARLAWCGPVTEAELAAQLAIDPTDIAIATARLELDGLAMRGRFRRDLLAEQWCDRALLARIHRRTVDGLRRAIEPASPRDYLRFLFAWQGVTGSRGRGTGALLHAIELLQGFEVAASAWEPEVLAARVDRYDPADLDALCLSGDVVWGRIAARDASASPSRAAPITLALRRDLGWLSRAYALADAANEVKETPSIEDDLATTLLALFERRGALFFDEIVAQLGRSRPDVEEALWQLVSAGRVTADGFANLRALFASRDPRPPAWRVAIGRTSRVVAGRWALLRPMTDETTDDAALERLARQYLRRYGVLTREVLTREPHAPPFRDLLRVLRLLEMRGEIRGGRLVDSLVGEHFALPEALDLLRATKKRALTGEVVRVSACDPLNLVGILTPGPRVPAHLGQKVVFKDGVPIDASDDLAVETVAS
jgi:ATP-dependent Lhr-like helicase